VGDGRKMGYRITGQGFENDIGFTAPFNFSAGGNAFGIGE